MSHSAAESFVPFEPGSGAGDRAADGPFRPSIVPESAGAPPPLAGKSPQSCPPAHGHTPEQGKPVVTLQRDGEKVTGIRIECSCGQVIDLGCSY